MKRCTYVGCLRACAATTSGGTEYALCDRHTRQYLAEAFAPVERISEWRRRAEAHRLPVKDYTAA